MIFTQEAYIARQNLINAIAALSETNDETRDHFREAIAKAKETLEQLEKDLDRVPPQS